MAISDFAGARAPVLLSGFALILVGIGFKLGVVPFHMWTPDVYEGAPAPSTAFLATASKGAMFALFVRFLAGTGALTQPGVFFSLSLIAAFSMFAGNLLALLQSNVKRLLAYSSIAHFGYLMVAVLSGNPLAVRAVMYYLAAYFVTTLGAFGVVATLSGNERDADSIEDYRGLYWRRPWIAAAFTASLLSLAGIPVTAGFVAKFYVLAAGVGSALWVLVLLLAANSAIGLFYYLRVVVAMCQRPAEARETVAARPDTPPLPGAPLGTPAAAILPAAVPAGAAGALSVLVVALVWLGIHPSTLERVILAVLMGR
jgi:NADH-quinone oxidoreductase subunit N